MALSIRKYHFSKWHTKSKSVRSHFKKYLLPFRLQLHSSIIAQSLRHRLEFDLKSKLKSLPHPILWVMGEHDHLYKSCLFDLKSILPNVLYTEIPLAGHAANLFRPNYFHDLYARFLNGKLQ